MRAARVERPRLADRLPRRRQGAIDLPLEELARRFERVVLVDIDAEAMAAVERSPRCATRKLRARA